MDGLLLEELADGADNNCQRSIDEPVLEGSEVAWNGSVHISPRSRTDLYQCRDAVGSLRPRE